jgi:hypothetical protein
MTPSTTTQQFETACLLFTVTLKAHMLDVVMLTVILLNVMVPLLLLFSRLEKHFSLGHTLPNFLLSFLHHFVIS